MGSQFIDAVDIGRHFHLEAAPQLQTVPVGGETLSVTRLDCPINRGAVRSVDLPANDAYLLMIYLRDTEHADILADGSRAPVQRYARGSICLVDLQCGAAIELHSSLDALAVLLPKVLLDDVARISPFSAPDRLICRRRHPDDVLFQLGSAIVPLFEQPGAANAALLRHVATAICAHILHEYGGAGLENGIAPSSLSIRQEKAAKALLKENFGGDVNLREIAEAIGLSPKHFAQVFRDATGVTPHKWVMKLRLDRAKEMLRIPGIPLRAIAAECGFADQSHFTKVFARETGATPAAWRSANLH